ncbi:MAG: hypothetical protein KAI43_11725 [Candidatus Aureabacteria bacterium]|nr:hypothetical protein [Candidatus Auribacterota bacterium]
MNKNIFKLNLFLTLFLSLHSIAYAVIGTKTPNISKSAENLIKGSGIKWRNKEGVHFIYYYSKRSDLVKFSKRAEKFYEKIKIDLNIKKDPDYKCLVYLVSGDSEWNRFISRINMRPGTGGFYTGREIFVPVEKKSFYKDKEKTFAHEICHLIFMNFWGHSNCPLWINEGMACYESSIAHKAINRMSFKAQNLKKKSLIPLKEIFKIRTYPEDPATNLTFYRQSEWIVKFLIEKHPKKLFSIFIKKLKNEPYNTENILLKVYSKYYNNFPDFEKKYLNFCRKQHKH